MTAFRYAIVRTGGYWRIVTGRKSIGLFLSADQAAKAAARLAREARRAGHEIEITLQSLGGELVRADLSRGGQPTSPRPA